jgi:prophage regulatory protein
MKTSANGPTLLNRSDATSLPPTANGAHPESLLRLPDVVRRTGMCRAKIYRLEGFPKPIKVAGRTSAWIASEVDAWIAKVIAEARRERAA